MCHLSFKAYIHIHDFSIDFIAANASSCINGAIRLNPLNGAIRLNPLNGSTSATQGLIEICIAGRWNRTCSSNINNDDARALCTIMGLPSNGKIVLIKNYVPIQLIMFEVMMSWLYYLYYCKDQYQFVLRSDKII